MYTLGLPAFASDYIDLEAQRGKDFVGLQTPEIKV